jgi:hypothetical protein
LQKGQRQGSYQYRHQRSHGRLLPG